MRRVWEGSAFTPHSQYPAPPSLDSSSLIFLPAPGNPSLTPRSARLLQPGPRPAFQVPTSVVRGFEVQDWLTASRISKEFLDFESALPPPVSIRTSVHRVFAERSTRGTS